MGRTTFREQARRPWRVAARGGGLVALALALLTASCGAGAPDAQGPSVPGAGTGVEFAVTADAAADGSVASTTTPSTIVPPPPTDPPPVEPPSLGDLELPCGRPGEASGPGVDDEHIVIGVGNDRGSLHAADSGAGVVGAIRALADHCNAVGGVAGRSVVVEELDAALIEVEERMIEACAEVFALVGHVYLRADEGAAARTDCGLPSFPARDAGVAEDTVDGPVSALTAAPEPVPLHGLVLSFVASPADGGRIALIGPNTPGGERVRERDAGAVVTSGFPLEVVANLGYPVVDGPDWSAIVRRARNAGAGTVHLDGPCRSVASPFLSAADDAGWHPAVVLGPESYEPACLTSLGGIDLTRVLLEMPLLPVSDGEVAATTGAMVDLYVEYGVPVTGDTLRAASAFWLWAEAATECGSGLDRSCLAEQGRAIDAWDAGGMHAPSDPGTSAVEPCVVLLGIDGGSIVRRAPLEPGTFDCDWRS